MDAPGDLRADDALAQPTRARLFALLQELHRPAGTSELADLVRLHPNGVRAHLERLQDAGLVKRARLRHGRGRPADVWAIAPGARPGGNRPEGYRDLGRWLARALALPGREIEEVGREIGRELVPPGSHELPEALESAFSALGFQPDVQPQQPGEVSVCLGNCPYRDAVRENQPGVCALHKGMTAGLLERLAPESRLAEFTPRDPDGAGCRIEIRRAVSIGS